MKRRTHRLKLAAEDLARRLRMVQSVLTVSALALRRQNADMDADIAEVLTRFANDPLDVLIEEIERKAR